MRCRRVLDIVYAVRFDVTIERESPTVISELPRQPMSIVRFRQFAVGQASLSCSYGKDLRLNHISAVTPQPPSPGSFAWARYVRRPAALTPDASTRHARADAWPE